MVVVFAPAIKAPVFVAVLCTVRSNPVDVSVALVAINRSETVAADVIVVDVPVGMIAVLDAPGVNPQSQLASVLKFVETEPLKVHVAACIGRALMKNTKIAAQAAMAIASDRGANLGRERLCIGEIRC